MLVTTAVLSLSATARRAVADLLGLGGVRVVQTAGPLPSPRFTELDLGRRVTLDEARAEAAFPVLVPEGMTPDEVYLGRYYHEGEVSLVFAAGPGIPQAHGTGAGMLITEFAAAADEDRIQKETHLGASTITGVEVAGVRGLWITGAPHAVYYIDARGRRITDSVRLAGNVLLWERAGVTYRIESALPLDRVLEIANSLS